MFFLGLHPEIKKFLRKFIESEACQVRNIQEVFSITAKMPRLFSSPLYGEKYERFYTVVHK
jgi:hypothetical protein